MKKVLSCVILLASVLGVYASERPVYNQGWSFSATGGASYMLLTNEEMRKMMNSHTYPVFDLRACCATSSANGGLYEAAYNYPTYGIGFTYSNLNSIEYSGSSHLNDIFDLYAFFERDMIRKRHFSFGYELLFGLGFSDNRYNPRDNNLNEAINSPVVFDIGMGPYVRFPLSSRFELDATLEFRHHSFGKLSYPNSGINEVLGLITARYYLNDAVSSDNVCGTVCVSDTFKGKSSFREMLSYEIYGGAGVERCVEEWDVYNTMEPDVSRKVSTINAYPKFFFSFHTTCRYAAKFSSGVGVDMFCSTQDYMDSLEKCERVLYGDEAVDNAEYNRFNCGLSLVQNFHYGNFAVWGLVGAYLYNHTGVSNSRRMLYQKIGVKYCFPKVSGFTLSLCCKTHHFSQAEMMEFGVAFKV